MPHVLIVRRIHESGINLLRNQADITLEILEDASRANLVRRLPEADGVTLRATTFDAELIASARRLKIVARHGVGYDNVDVDALSARRIPLAIAGTANSTAVAEHALTMALAIAKRIVPLDTELRGGRWQTSLDQPIRELSGSTALVIGFGRTGSRSAPLFRALGMNVLVHDPYVARQRIEDAGFTLAATLAEALRIADVVTIHVPLSAQTRGLVDPFAMKRDAILVCTARGGVVDEKKLAGALATGHLMGAGMDVFEEEPAPAKYPLWDIPNLLVTPHTAGLSDRAMEKMSINTCQNVIDAFRGKLDRENVVNGEILD